MYGVIVYSGGFPTLRCQANHANREAEYQGQHDEPRAGQPSSPDRNASAETTVNSPASAHEIDLRIISPHFGCIPSHVVADLAAFLGLGLCYRLLKSSQPSALIGFGPVSADVVDCRG